MRGSSRGGSRAYSDAILGHSAALDAAIQAGAGSGGPCSSGGREAAGSACPRG
ncbi:MAG: hypothetical protein ACLP36_08265 [Acidimicrobiales bacterium]